MKVRYTPPALADLASILKYVGERSPQGATRIRASIKSAERLLARHPKLGRKTRLKWLRRTKTSSYSYLVFYEVTDLHVVIHAVRDPRSMPGSS